MVVATTTPVAGSGAVLVEAVVKGHGRCLYGICSAHMSAGIFTVVTDHNPLVHLQTQSVLSRRQTRWSEYLQMFTYMWLCRPGTSEQES